MIPSRSAATALFALCILAGPPIEGEEEEKALSFPIGEKLVYRAIVVTGGDVLGEPIGKGLLRCRWKEDGVEGVEVSARAEGKVFAFVLEQELSSVLDPETGASRVHTSRQGGTSISWKRTTFAPDQAEYWKMKHCKGKDGTCDANHYVDGDPEQGHCMDRHCGLMEHRTWSLRDRVPLEKTVHDPLSVLLAARRDGLGAGSDDRTYRVLVDDRLWDVTIHTGEGETVETPAGKFETIRITLDPTYADSKPPHEKGGYQGLFGMEGDLRILVDRDRGFPVRIRGRVPFLPHLKLEFLLEEVHREEEAPVKPPPR